MSNAKIKSGISYRLRRLLTLFLQGLLITLPSVVTYQLIKSTVRWIDEFLQLETPGLGFVIVICSITFLGYIGTNIVTRPILDMFDDIFSRIPFIKNIYTSVKDLVEAFVGDKKKFSKPVVVEMSPGLYKPGFITNEDLSELNLPGLVAVYFPHSYAFSGNVFFLEKSRVKHYDTNATDFLKFIITGGVTEMDQSNQVHDIDKSE
jgi:uncharacterized membrane protein